MDGSLGKGGGVAVLSTPAVRARCRAARRLLQWSRGAPRRDPGPPGRTCHIRKVALCWYLSAEAPAVIGQPRSRGVLAREGKPLLELVDRILVAVDDFLGGGVGLDGAQRPVEGSRIKQLHRERGHAVLWVLFGTGGERGEGSGDVWGKRGGGGGEEGGGNVWGIEAGERAGSLYLGTGKVQGRYREGTGKVQGRYREGERAGSPTPWSACEPRGPPRSCSRRRRGT